MEVLLLVDVHMCLSEARAAETPTNDLPIGYIGELFGTEAQVTSIAWCFDNPPLRP